MPLLCVYLPLGSQYGANSKRRDEMPFPHGERISCKPKPSIAPPLQDGLQSTRAERSCGGDVSFEIETSGLNWAHRHRLVVHCRWEHDAETWIIIDTYRHANNVDVHLIAAVVAVDPLEKNRTLIYVERKVEYTLGLNLRVRKSTHLACASQRFARKLVVCQVVRPKPLLYMSSLWKLVQAVSRNTSHRYTLDRRLGV